ncbi:zinc metalloproteinase nas-14-like [Sabethes cyaneus]|uniref:zinc metalloproteinase nas-14-like n=1 Tax=Sabethes cyaneus TaxID=53552 RepID=UPI00237ED970|nr:zinc metalloproteinase nas-14-like [Sabethes cyaneus]
MLRQRPVIVCSSLRVKRLLLLLMSTVVIAHGRLYHVFEELGQKTYGDLVIPETGADDGKNFREGNYTWSENSIPYLLSNLTADEKLILREAMDYIESRSCVKFVSWEATSKNFLVITRKDSGCWADLGMIGGAQIVNLDPRGCFTVGSILHQLLHTLGFTHPTSRPDRDLYIQVNYSNINLHDHHYMEKFSTPAFDDFGIPYDYDSIMHRSGYAFSSNGKETIIALDGSELGQRDYMSVKDIKKLNMMYPCNPT